MKTEEEKKESQRLACKKYNDANKEKAAARYIANKEAVNARHKKYYLANKEKLDAKSTAYYLANKESIAARAKAYVESKKDGFFTVYLLPKDNYVGQTSNMYRRLFEHKSESNRDTTDAKVLGKYKTREEALAIEASYHAKGYLGFNSGK